MNEYDKYEKVINNLMLLLRGGNSLCLGLSGGKDSSCCLILMLEAVRRLRESNEHIPKCYVIHSDTGIENPAMEIYAKGVLLDLDIYINKMGLSDVVEVREVTPALSGRFTWTTIARGKLPRYPGQSRDCARDMKITPQQRELKAIEKETSGNFISIVGSRSDESVARKNSLNRFQMDEITISVINNSRTFAPIANFDVDDVWELICAVSVNPNTGKAKYFSTYRDNFDDMTELYRDANDGLCAVLVGDAGKSSCGSRFGCSICLLSGARDKSMESLIAESSKYEYLSGLTKLRNYLFAIRWDMSRRDLRGRMIKGGYLKVSPNYWNAHTKRELLRYMITLDAIEKDRARKHEAEYYAEGSTLERSEENKQKCFPLFELVSYADITAIDFQWSISRDFNEAAPAAKDYIEIHDLGFRYYIPTVEAISKTSIPKDRWFNISASIESVGRDVLFGALPHRRGDIKVETSGQLSVVPGSGLSYIETIRKHYYQLGDIPAGETARIILHRGYMTMAKKDLKMYEAIAIRNEAIRREMIINHPMSEDLMTGEDVLMTTNDYLLFNSISTPELDEILKNDKRQLMEEEEQFDLFGIDSLLDMMDSEAKPTTTKSDIANCVVAESIKSHQRFQQPTLF